MADYLVYDAKSSAQAAADNVWAKYGPTVHETDLAGQPSKRPQVTQRWDVPRQRKSGEWIIQDHPTLKPDLVNAAKATETYDQVWFAITDMTTAGLASLGEP